MAYYFVSISRENLELAAHCSAPGHPRIDHATLLMVIRDFNVCVRVRYKSTLMHFLVPTLNRFLRFLL